MAGASDWFSASVRPISGNFWAMTLTPPRIGDLAARSPTQRLLDKKSPGESNAARWNVADAPDKKPAVCRNPDGAAAGIAPDVCRWFVRSPPRITSRVFPFCFYGGDAGLSERRPNLCCWRVAGETSLACLLGALAAAPGSVAMLAHRLTASRAFAVLFDHRFHDLDNLRLLSAWQSGHRIEGLPGFA